MNAAQSLALTRFVRAACPQQKIDEYTPDAWHELLADLEFTDANQAVRDLAKRQPFISPAEIRSQVRHLRAARIERCVEDVPDADANPNDITGYLDKLRATRRRIADGWTPQTRPVLPMSDDVRKLLEDTVEALPKMPTAKPRADLAKKRLAGPS